jgi:hypothetical protein
MVLYRFFQEDKDCKLNSSNIICCVFFTNVILISYCHFQEVYYVSSVFPQTFVIHVFTPDHSQIKIIMVYDLFLVDWAVFECC